MNMIKVVALLSTALVPGLLTAEPVITKHAVVQAFNELGNATDEYPKLPKKLVL